MDAAPDNDDQMLAAVVAETEGFVAAAGWDQPVQVFSLVRTADLIAAEPQLADQLSLGGALTPIAQDALPSGDLSAALAGLAWPDAVVGCVLVQEIVVLPPAAAAELADQADPDTAAAAHPERQEARLAAGVLRTGAAACLLRLRAHPDSPLRGAELAPNLLQALLATFED